MFDLTNGYQSVLITRADRGLETIEKLKGASLSLTDPASTSGALYPRHVVPELTGQTLEAYFDRVTFAGSHDRAIDAVKQGLVDAAFVATIQLDEYIRRGLLRKDELKIVWRSEIIPFDPFVYRKRLCAPLAEKLRKAFLEDQAEMKPMFEQLKLPGFIPANDERYRSVRKLYQSVLN
jgi:phosphonate transport system substrate-binding protein